jgi:L-aminopeptidase/D-esterase-like protein
MNASLTAIAGLRVGHWSDVEAQTGCTVVLCPPEGCVASASVRGGGPATRETDLLAPERTVERIHALVLAGGSAFGLAAADGVMAWLEARGIGFDAKVARVPIVPAAAIFDLAVGRSEVRPTAEAGYAAAEAATADPVPCGRLGAGMGAVCGHYGDPQGVQYGGLGSACIEVAGVRVAALAVINPMGDIIDPHDGQLVAGARLADGRRPTRQELYARLAMATPGAHTTLVCVATDALVSKVQCRVLADSAHIGIARVIRPSHTAYDGDAAFALSTGTKGAVSVALLTVAVQDVVAEAILAGVRAANTI